MKNHHIVSMEVKTVYAIALTTEDLENILTEVLQHDRGVMKALDAFQQFDLTSLTPSRSSTTKLRELWAPGSNRAATNTINYIVHEVLGYDGVENYGYYEKNTGEIRMVVYNKGDRVNV